MPRRAASSAPAARASASRRTCRCSPGLPPLVRDGDRFSAMLTLRNTTAREMKVRVSLQGTANLPGDGAIARVPIALPAQDVVVAAGAAKEVVWSVDVPGRRLQHRLGSGAPTKRERQGSAQGDAARRRPPCRCACCRRRWRSSTARTRCRSRAPADALPEVGAKRGGLNVAVQPQAHRRAARDPSLLRDLPVHLPRAEDVEGGRPEGRAALGGVANALPTYLDSDGLASYFPPPGDGRAARQRPAHRLRARGDARGRLRAARRRRARRCSPASRRSSKAGSSASSGRRGPTSTCSKLAAIEALSRYGRAQPKMRRLDQRHAQRLADRGGDRLAEHPASACRQSPTAPSASTKRSRSCAPATDLRRHDAYVQHRGRRLLVVADGQRRRQRGAADPRRARRSGVAGRAAEDGRRQPRTPARRRVADDDRQPLGLARARQVLGALRGDAVDGRTLASLTATTAPHVVGSSVAAASASSPTGAVRPRAARSSSPGRTRGATLDVVQQGAGKPWLTVQSLAAIPLKAPLRAGYSIARSVSAVEQKDKGKWSRGDVLRVRLEIDAQSRHDLGRRQRPGAGRRDDPRQRPRPRLADRDPRREAQRPRLGRRSRSAASRPSAATTSTCRAASTSSSTRCGSTTPGRFALPPTRVEAMYAPETFGETPNDGDRGRAVTRIARSRARGASHRRSCSAARSSPAARTPCRASPRSRRRTGRPTSRCVDRHGTPIQTVRVDKDVRRLAWTPLAEMSPALLTAIVLSEDRRFYEHGGVDWQAAAKSAWGNLVEHANARRVDADDAARRPDRRRPGAAARRPQRRRRSSARR